MSAVLVALMLAPYLVEPGDMRLVSEGTGDAIVEWYLEGQLIATTQDGVPALVALPSGTHELWATTHHEGDWQILARQEPDAPGVTYVDAWTARHDAPDVPPKPVPQWWMPAGLAAVGAALWAWPSRSKNP